MALVTLSVGGRRYELACRDGDQAHLQEMAAMVDAKAADAGRALGPTNEARQLLMAALLLADDLAGARLTPQGDNATEGLAEAIDVLAGRVEQIVEALEKGALTP